MTQAIVLRGHGGPEELRLETVDRPPLGLGELRIRQTAVGVNFHDIYVRSGLYQTLALPGVPGIEGVGAVVEIGPGVIGFEVDERIAYVSAQYGAYADERILPATLALKPPAFMSDAQAAATLMKALTVGMLVRQVHRVEAGQTLLVHAAAGGVGRLLCQWASHLGARVIGTVGDPSKASVARAAGAAEIILRRDENLVESVEALTGGRGVDVVYDSIGADTFADSLRSLAFCGRLVNFGQSSGPVAPFAPAMLAARSLTLSRPVIFHYMRSPAQLAELAHAAFEALEQGVISPIDPLELPLAEAGRAHQILEAGRSPGGVVLTMERHDG